MLYTEVCLYSDKITAGQTYLSFNQGVLILRRFFTLYSTSKYLRHNSLIDLESEVFFPDFNIVKGETEGVEGLVHNAVTIFTFENTILCACLHVTHPPTPLCIQSINSLKFDRDVYFQLYNIHG